MTLPKWRVTAKLLAGKKDKQMELPHVEPDLVIGANILKIIAYSNGTKILTFLSSNIHIINTNKHAKS